jgi:O-antigen ligase
VQCQQNICQALAAAKLTGNFQQRKGVSTDALFFFCDGDLMYELWEKRALAWLAAMMTVGLLLPNHYSPWLSIHQEIATAFAFAPLLLLSAWRGAKPPVLAWLATGVALYVVIQYLTGKIVFSTDAWMALLYLLGFALAVNAGAHLSACAATNSNELQALKPLIYLWCGLLLAAVLSVGIAAHQWLMPQYQGIYVAEIPPGARPFANLAQPNQLASLLLLGLAGLVFLWESKKISPLFASVLALWIDWGLVLTGSRSVLLAFFWLLPAYFFLRKQSLLRLPMVALFALYAAYFALSWFWPLASELLLLESPGSTAVDRMGAADVRKVFWFQMLDAVDSAPWFGWGWGQIGAAQTATALDHPATHAYFDSAHNLFLDLALWAGLPVAILTSVVLGGWFWKQVRTVRSPQAWASLMGVGFIFSHAMVEYPLYYAYFLLPIGLLMGALSGSNSHPNQNNHNSVWPRIPIVLMSATAALLSARVVWEYFPFETDWQLMRFQEARIGSRAITEPPPAAILTSLHEFLRWSRVEPTPNMPAQDIEQMRKISERFAYAAPMYRLALSQALNGQSDAAQLTLARLCRMQSKMACESALKDWVEKSTGEFPQLKAIALPESH